MQLARLFIVGMIISFMGTLSPSPLNLSAMQISVQEGVRFAMYFSVGTILSELIYVRICLVGVHWLQHQKIVIRWLEWITFLLVLALAIGSFVAASKNYPAQNVILDNHINRFLFGVIMSALTPMHIPFWLTWSTVLFSKKILSHQTADYFIYLIGIGLGTFFANWLYIDSGKYVIKLLNDNHSILNYAIGGVFAATAVIILIKILLHKDVSKKLESIEEDKI